MYQHVTVDSGFVADPDVVGDVADDDANLIVLCNVEPWACGLRDAVFQTWRGP